MDKTKIAVDLFDRRAREYQEKFMDVRLYGDSFDLFCDRIDKVRAEVLDIACGPGNITRYLLDRRPDLNILGVDLAANMIALARVNNPEAEFSVMDARHIASLRRKFDAIMCGFCLPYLSQEEAAALFRDAAAMLHEGGLLYLSTMEGDYSLSGLEKGSTGESIFIHYHEADHLLGALSAAGFQLVHLDRKVYPGREGKMTTDLIVIAEQRGGKDTG
ncbi:MAG: methyltransferase domain-containing protein [Saprospiraceae bacterium]